MPELTVSTLAPILLGLLLLFLGRKIFWLFAGGVVFVVVMDVAPRFVHHQESTIFYVALGVGVLAAAAGYFVQKIALRVAGFVAGGFLTFTLMEQHFPQVAVQWWIPALAGGIVGAVIVSFLFEWALIILSSIIGAYLITSSLNLEGAPSLASLVVLSMVGILVQARTRRGKSKNRD
ncbi:MAG TPA: hypothetical protein VNL69_07435 [Bacteroidota bacterium]|nr:hypothetical protein [Bacteroidota bacterium]